MTYIDEEQLPLHFCPGCAHDLIVKRIDDALVRINPDPKKTVVVTDIGCAGLTDKYFITNAFHGLHGRSVTYGSGIKLANPELTVIVMIGDGGCGIGGHHLINAARRNIGINVFVFDNFNFGMTGGQHSITTPIGGVTATTKTGNYEYPIDICETVRVNHAGWVGRTTAYDPDVTDLMTEAIQHEGFALLDIWGMCSAYYMPSNKLTRKTLKEMMVNLNMKKGVLHKEEREELGAYLNRPHRSMMRVEKKIELESKFRSNLQKRCSIVLAGSAGQKIKSSATIFGRAGILSGLWATQKDDYPVTVMTGYSVAEIILDENPVNYTGIPRPEYMLVVSEDGLKKLKTRIEKLTPDTKLLYDPRLELPTTQAEIVPLPFEEEGLTIKKKQIPLAALAYCLKSAGLFPMDALREAISISQREEIAGPNLAAIDAVDNLK
jgi:pyruvate/2-oxoacid:ferredoxin oxidoreductase beta subunit